MVNKNVLNTSERIRYQWRMAWELPVKVYTANGKYVSRYRGTVLATMSLPDMCRALRNRFEAEGIRVPTP